jgi:hypothetical protein
MTGKGDAQAQAAARAALDDDAYARAVEVGQGLTNKQAVEETAAMADLLGSIEDWMPHSGAYYRLTNHPL